MKRQRPAVKFVKEISASPGTAAPTRVVLDKRTACDGTCGKCPACKDDFFFQQICDEVQGMYENKTVQ
jgi:hypothetical protein